MGDQNGNVPNSAKSVFARMDTFRNLSQLNPRKFFRTHSVRATSDCRKLFYECWAEFWGTMMIIIGGCGSVASAVAVGEPYDLWQIAMIWGFTVTLAIYSTASVSGAHLNPAVTFALAIFKNFPWRKVGWYWAAQMIGGIAGGGVNLLIFYTYVERQEKLDDDMVRGGENSERLAMMFGEYFPNPGWAKGKDNPNSVVSPFGACCVEAWGTAILMFMILALTDEKQRVMVRKEMAPFFIGFTVAVLISLYAPITQAGWNPARDFGPRVVAAIAGWDDIAIPGPRHGFWVYIVGPMIGAPIGAAAYILTIEPGLRILAEEAP